MATHRAKPLCGIDLNYEVVGGSTAPTSFKKENTIWIDTDIDITEHCFSYNDPEEYTESTESYNQVWSVESAYLSNTGAVVTGDSYWNITAYIDISTAIQVSYTGITYIEDNRTNICFYDSSQTLLSVTAMATGTNTISVPSGVHYLRMSVRKNDKTDYQTLYIHVTNKTHTYSPDIWIQTDIDKASVGFNAIKRNELMVYPYKLKQWNGSTWKNVGGSLYQGSTATLIYSAETQFYPGAIVSNTGVGDANISGFGITGSVSGTNISSKTPYIAVDLTDIKTLTVKGNISSSGAASVAMFLATKAQLDYGSQYKGYYVSDQSDTNYYTIKKQGNFTEWVIDTQSYTGTYYLAICGYNWNGSGSWDASVTSVIGE